jgi:hypothetical protein
MTEHPDKRQYCEDRNHDDRYLPKIFHAVKGYAHSIVCAIPRGMPSLTGLEPILRATRHSRAGLSHIAASRLDSG